MPVNRYRSFAAEVEPVTLPDRRKDLPPLVMKVGQIEAMSPCQRAIRLRTKPSTSRATCAGSSFRPWASFVSSIPARTKSSVSVGPGCSAVTVTPESCSSTRMPSPGGISETASVASARP